MMRFTGGAGRALERAIASNEDPAVALQLAGVAARLGDRFRRGLLTLRHLEDGPDGKPGKFIGLVWGGPEATPAAAGSAPANDTLDPAAATPATAGHGCIARIHGPQPEFPLAWGRSHEFTAAPAGAALPPLQRRD